MDNSLTTKAFFVMVFAFMVLIGVDVHIDRGRTLECRIQAQTKGVAVNDAVQLCKR